MPIASSDYAAPAWLIGGHAQTLYATLFRGVDFQYKYTERISTPDDDFLNLHWTKPSDAGSVSEPSRLNRVAVLTHGLEGSAQRNYMRGMAKTLVRHGWDVVAWDLRGCGEELNRTVPTYHSGKTEDLDVVVQHALSKGYDQAALVGFSLGGNMTLKYVGERGEAIDDRIQRAVAISTPVDLEASSRRISERSNWHYTQYFLRSLRETVRQKAERHPNVVDRTLMQGVRTLTDFDNAFTAPLNGFRDAQDYYRQSSSKQYLGEIAIPTLLLNAANDPFLPDECYPHEIARDHNLLTLDTPGEGGHVGFVSSEPDGAYFSEIRTADFLSQQVVAITNA
ncbi:alpha/beta hydrolase [Longibacter salinarum]|uniref:Alpha/beta hydrolase n=1 Tax=Longibacter salinarum TaxID=1850348 RepID=A0A2A8CWQ5_9BACT|nr:alpha/beta fold hydrolase [Longibacter salinarum]PEN13027.1 alpha/beta hydrolase [Longibacter salinarum]